MWLIAGLGNPGREYQGTRHNVGFRVADELARRGGLSFSERKFRSELGRGRLAGVDVLLIKPQTFMNLCGESVGPALGFYKLVPEVLVVIHDELDLPLGRTKLKQGGGHGGHNGLRSLVQHLPSAEFIRVRLGIGRPPPRWDPADYVLSRFEASETEAVDRMVEEAAGAVEVILRNGLAHAMRLVHGAPGKRPEESATKKETRAPAEGGEPRPLFGRTKTGHDGDDDG